MICPATPLATASGLMMVRVRWAAIAEGSLPFLADHAGHGGAHVGGTLDGGDAGGLHGGHLLGCGPLAAGDDRAGVAHAAAGRRGLAADETDNRFGDVSLDEGGGLFLGGAADLADHHDRGRVRIGLEELQHVDEVGAVHRIAADAHARGLAAPALGELVHHLVGERAAAGDDTHVAFLVDVARHDPDLGLAGRDEARAVGADEPALGAAEEGLHAHHVRDRHALGNTDDERHPRVRRLHDRVGGGGRRHEDQGTVRAGGRHRGLHRVPDREALVSRPAFARRHPAHDLGAVLLAAGGVEGAFLAGDALHQHARVLVDQHAHARALRASSTTFFAPSPMSSAITRARPDSASIFLPCSTLVPSARNTTGSFRPSFFTAEMMPSASRSTLRIPPNTLMKTAFTLGSEERMRKACSICSGEAPPPTSRKLAGSPPASLMMSMVAIARPAPFTMQPTFPSSLM